MSDFPSASRGRPGALPAALAGLLAVAGPAVAASADDYARAEAMLPWHLEPLLHNVQIEPHWIEEGRRFWYRRTDAAGASFVLVDVADGRRTPAFDHQAVARGLGDALGRDVQPHALPFQRFEFLQGRDLLRVEVAGRSFDCAAGTPGCTEVAAPVPLREGEVASPDGQWAAFVRDDNLDVRSRVDGREIRLTEDGVEHHGYGTWADSHLLSVSTRVQGRVRPARVLWSADSRRLATYRVDQRQVTPIHYVQWVPPEGYGARPVVHEARVPFPADEHVATAAVAVFEIPDGRRIDSEGAPFFFAFDPIDWGQLWWSADGAEVFHVVQSRGNREVRLFAVDARTGQRRQVLEERGPSFLSGEYRRWARTGTVRDHLLWRSTRDGWQHLYLHDVRDGRLRRQLTQGEWAVSDVLHFDEAAGWVYFTAGGREPGRDPYYHHLYRVRVDGSDLSLLTPEDAHHEIRFSPAGTHFIDRRSTVGEAPVTVLRTAEGREVAVLERADIGALTARGWKPPERFRTKARDGRTDIYGVIWYPSGFDPARRYPVLDSIYGGPQSIYAPRAFSPTPGGEGMAELGFVVVRIDGMGTPGRSKAFQDVSYGKGFAEAGGLEDHIAALRELARDRPWLDLDRVGIYGHSGGGYSSVRAMLDYPEFFKVAVSSAGSHDQYLYELEWGERFIGPLAGNEEAYALQANSRHVERFAGKLLLAHGDLDDDVPIVNSIQLADALIKANKDFELLLVPGADHASLAQHPYFIRRRWDFFVQHLQGAVPPAYQVRAP